MAEETTPGKRRIDRILAPAYTENLMQLELAALRERRDESLAEREYLSLLRRLVQGRLDILRAESVRRVDGDDRPLVDRLASVLSTESSTGPSRGEALRVGLPEEEMMLARRRVEALVADAAISDPRSLSDESLRQVIETLEGEENDVSEKRSNVMAVLDRLQDELKRRYKENPAEALSS